MRFGLRELIFILLLLAVPVGAYMFLFRRSNAQIAEARAEIASKQAKLKELQQSTARIEDLGGEIDKLSNAIAMFEKKLPAQREVEVILKQVWELAADNHLTPKSVRTDKIVPAADYAELPIHMTIVGDFDGFYSFLLKLEKLPRITRLRTMKLKRLDTDKDKSDGRMEADVVLSIFFEQSHRGHPHDGGGRSTARADTPAPAQAVEG